MKGMMIMMKGIMIMNNDGDNDCDGNNNHDSNDDYNGNAVNDD